MRKRVPILVILGAALVGAGCGREDVGGELAPVEPRIHPELEKHTQHFEKKIYRVAGNIYSAVGWNLANSIMVVGDDGVIIVDTGENTAHSREVAERFREITDKPVRAVIYTHFHPDHINGTRAFVSEERVRSGEVEIYAHETLLDNVIHQGATVGPILGMRTAYSFGLALPEEDVRGMNGGIGPRIEPGEGSPSTFIAPTRTFRDRLDVEIAGVEMRLMHVPSEAPDEVAVYLPDNDVLLSGETIQGPTLPNIHTLRGTKFRDPVQWVASIDRLRALEAEHLVPSHGQPVSGADRVEEVLRYTRDGIQFVHDQTVRWMNKGLTPDELVRKVDFPEHLAEYRPYLRQYYGTVDHAVRQIYQGYLGWFEGDPVGLRPTPPAEKAERLVALMGGRDRVLREAKEVYRDGDYQWAAELATYLIRLDRGDMPARQVKALAFRQLGYASMNINWRNWYLMSAQELEGKMPVKQVAGAIRESFASAELLDSFPPSVWLRGWALRVDPDEAADTHTTVGFRFTDIDRAWALELRRGVVQLHEGVPAGTKTTVVMTKALLDRIILGETTLREAIADGDAEVEGSKLALRSFAGNFDFGEEAIYLTLP